MHYHFLTYRVAFGIATMKRKETLEFRITIGNPEESPPVKHDKRVESKQ